MNKIIEEAEEMAQSLDENDHVNSRDGSILLRELAKQLKAAKKVIDESKELKSSLYYYGMATTLPGSLLTRCNEFDEALKEYEENKIG